MAAIAADAGRPADASPPSGHPLVRRLPRLAAAAAAGVMVWTSFPPVDWWPGAIAGFALLAWVLAHRRTTVVGGSGYGLVFGLAFYLPLLPWAGAFVGAVAWLALSAVCALFPALFAATAVAVRHLPGWPIWWAAGWVASEWLKSVVPFGGFPWGIVTFGQAGGPLVQLVPWGGVALTSFTVTLSGFTITALLLAWRRHAATSSAVAAASVTAGLMLLTAASGLGWQPWRSGEAARSLTVAAVQGNVPRLGLDFNAQRRAVLDLHLRETLRLADDVRAGRDPRPDLVVWPENSSDVDPLIDPAAARQIDTAAQAIGAPVLVGTVLNDPPWSTDPRATSNTVIVWSPGTGPGARHDKKILQPFGEYLPWRPVFGLFSAYAGRAGFFVPGGGPGVVNAAGTPVGVATCWEVVFDRAPRDAVRNGAEILVVPTNNATFNETMSRQLLAFTRIRALEHGRSVVVAGTTGISAIITPAGQIVDQTAFFTSDHLLERVELSSDLTPATRWAPWIDGLLTAAALTALIGAAAQRHLHTRRRRRVERRSTG